MANTSQDKIPGSWPARPTSAGLIRIAALAIPVATATGVAVAAAVALPPPDSIVQQARGVVLIMGVSLLALLAIDRLARRLLPLSTLLSLALAFPDRAPARFKSALRAGSGSYQRRAIEQLQAGTASEAEAAEAIVILLGALTLHDRRTRGHSERVRAFAELIAEEMGLDDSDRDRLRWAALLHDVGKLVVPHDVLHKPGKPDDEEWAILRSHPIEGGRLAEPLREWLGDWALSIEEHHERFDGGGYPAGLSGRAISVGARIIAVADSFEVMTSVRSYKRPMSPRAARHELVAWSGAQFDPVVVRAFLALSLRRLRWALGPFSALASVPLFGSLRRLRKEAAVPLAVGGLAAGMLAVAVIPQITPPRLDPPALPHLVSPPVTVLAEGGLRIAGPPSAREAAAEMASAALRHLPAGVVDGPAIELPRVIGPIADALVPLVAQRVEALVEHAISVGVEQLGTTVAISGRVLASQPDNGRHPVVTCALAAADLLGFSPMPIIAPLFVQHATSVAETAGITASVEVAAGTRNILSIRPDEPVTVSAQQAAQPPTPAPPLTIEVDRNVGAITQVVGPVLEIAPELPKPTAAVDQALEQITPRTAAEVAL